MAKEPTTPLRESPPLSLYETAGASRSVIDLLKMLKLFHKASSRRDQAPVSQVVANATKVLLNHLGKLKLVEFRRPKNLSYELVQIKPVYMLTKEVKDAINAYLLKGEEITQWIGRYAGSFSRQQSLGEFVWTGIYGDARSRCI